MITLKEYIEQNGYTIKEWAECVDELCKKGVGKGCYQDYNLLQLLINWLCDYTGQSMPVQNAEMQIKLSKGEDNAKDKTNA